MLNKEDKNGRRLVLVGEPDNSLPIVGQIDKLGLKEKVLFTGKISDDQLIDLYSEAAVFVFPSLFEGFGLPPLEAMAAGTPVISSNKASLLEVCGEGAFLVDPTTDELFSAIKKVLEDDEFSKSLVEKGMARAREFKWTETAKTTLNIYRELYEKEVLKK